MSTPQMGFDQEPKGHERSQARLDKLASLAAARVQLEKSDDDSVGRTSIAGRTAGFNRLIAQHDRARAVATTIRTMDQTMETVGTAVGAMRKELEVIAKDLPPSPQSDHERIKRLNSYAELRALIGRLTAPPEWRAQETAHRKELDALLANDTMYVVGPNGMTKTVLTEEVHIGPGGIHTPQISPSETLDAGALAVAIAELDDASATLWSRRESLVARTRAISQSLYDRQMADGSAEAASVELGQDLAGQPVGIAHESTAELDQLLG